MQSLGRSVSDAESQDLINGVDPDVSGTIDSPDFLTMMTRKLKDSDFQDDLAARNDQPQRGARRRGGR